jgi:antitoxin MazE
VGGLALVTPLAIDPGRPFDREPEDALAPADTLCIFSRVKTSVQKWGNSLGIRIPKVVAEETSLRSGSVVELVREGEVLVVRPLRRRRRAYRLDELVRGITPGNCHSEIEVGPARGREAW